MTNMTRFVVFDNALSGTVPSEFGNMEELDVLSLYQNPKINGDMPQEVCALKEEGQGQLSDVLVTCAEDDESDTGVKCPPDCCICKKR